MKIENILKAKGRSIETIGPHAPVTTAIQRLVTAGIGALVVSSDGETVLGVIAERDVMRALSRHGAAALDRRVSDVMSTGVSTATADATLADVMGQMTRSRQRHLPVLEHGKLVGIVSVGDLVKSRLDELELETNVRRDAYVAHRFANR
jgi:CBS domain-containing protein